MKNKYIFLLSLFVSIAAFAQPKPNYYKPAEGKSGENLRTALYDVISNPYKNIGYGGLWGLYYTSDTIHIDGQVYIWDMYSTRGDRSANYRYKPGENQDKGSGGGKEGHCYNREHSVPQSWFSKKEPMRNDAYHVFPTDKKVNNVRGNDPFGEVGSATFTSQNGSKYGEARSGLGYSGVVFEPIDAYKGDLARGHLYMAVRYAGGCSSWGGGVFGDDNSGFENWAIDMLLKWHRNDPVSEKERNRNNAVEAKQRNRNPFVDHPELAEFIWGNRKGETWMLTTTIDVPSFEFLLLENPVRDEIRIQHQEPNLFYMIFDLSGRCMKIGEIHSSETIPVSDLTSGLYLLRLQSGDKNAVLKIVVNR